jgi:DNA-binding NtrC family response regulator
MSKDTTLAVESPSLLYREGRIGFEHIWTASPVMEACLGKARRVARFEMDVLLLGATGTGKNLIAQALHNASRRAAGPFVAANTASIPTTLAEDELFGHEAGAFSDAKRRRRGYFEQADGGTLFLDEIANMSPEVQAKILSAVESRRIRRLGAEEDVRCDARLVCATNADVDAARASGAFREDLYHRLAGLVLRVPPLRDRPEDIPLLTKRFIRLDNVSFNRAVQSVSEPCVRMMMKHEWPGNVRELRRRISSGVALCERAVLEAAHVFPEAAGDDGVQGGSGEEPLSLAAVERRHIAKVLAMTGWNISQSARVLGISRPTLRDRIATYGLEKPST